MKSAWKQMKWKERAGQRTFIVLFWLVVLLLLREDLSCEIQMIIAFAARYFSSSSRHTYFPFELAKSRIEPISCTKTRQYPRLCVCVCVCVYSKSTLAQTILPSG